MKSIKKSRASTILLLFVGTLVLSGCHTGAKKARILERADGYFKAGEYEKAKVEYMNMLRLDHQNAKVYQQLGFIWSAQGVPLRAVPFLQKACELNPQNVAAHSKLALGLMALGQRAEARKEALLALQQDQANPDAAMLVADSSHDKAEVAAAEEALEKVVQKNTSAFHLARASLAMKREDIGAASEEVKQAIATDPKSARAHLVRGYLYLLRKNPEHAEPELKMAAELAPARSEERIKYAEFKAANGTPEEAKSVLQSITKEAPDYIPAWRDLAQIALSEKNNDEALSLLENVFSRDPDNPEARIVQAQAFLGKGDSVKAIAGLDRLNTAAPNNPLIKYQLARAYAINKQPNQAISQLDQAIRIKPDYIEAILFLAELNLRSGKAQPVLKAMEDLRKNRPDLPQARILLASAYQLLGRLEEAASIFREQIQQTPQAPDAHFFLGVIRRQQKKNAEARLEFEKTLELTPDNWLAIDNLTEMDIADKRYDVATRRVQAYIERKSDQAPGHYTRSKIDAARQDWPHAEAELQKAMDLDPNFGAAYEALVSVYLAQNKLPQAIVELNSALKQRPRDARVLLTLGLLYDRMKDYEKARDVYEKVISANPDAVGALNNLAYLYAERFDQLDRAYELAQKARNLQPGDGSIADSLGWILFKRGDYQQALPLLQESAGKLPDNAEVQFHLGMTASMMGQADIARIALEKAAKSPVDFPGKAEAQRRFASLQNGSAPSETSESSDLLALTREAEDLEKKGEFVKAAEAYERAVKLNPKLGNLALKLAQIYGGPLQNHNKALEFAKKARALNPNDTAVGAVLGQIAFQSDNFSWAYSLLQEIVRKGTNNPGVLHDFALAAYALGKVPEARQAMQRSLEVRPNPSLAEEAKTFLAVTSFEEPSSEAVTAQSEVEEILKTQPDYVPALMARAAIQMQRNDRNAATEVYSKVLQKYPDFAPAQKRLAAIYAENQGNLVKAYDLAMKARKTLPDDRDLALTLAEISYQRREFPYAIQLFRESGAKQPLPAKDLYYLGMAQLQMKQSANARETLQRALSAGLQDPFATDAKKRLAEEQPK